MRILVVDDDAELRRLVAITLRGDGHEVRESDSGEAALGALAAAAPNERPELLVLDVNMPGLSGFEVLRRVRVDSAVPVLMLTVRAGESDQVRGLDLGADDYLGKPFERAEFEARVRALLRRGRGTATEFGALKWSWESHQGWIDGQPLTLTRNETIVLEAVLHAAGRIVSKASLAQRAAADDEPTSDNSIEVYVYRLRRKLEPAGLRIKTVRGLGYSLQVDS